MFIDDQPTVIYHPENVHGRDFIVGDIHGCTYMLFQLMNHVQFNKSCDRLFLVGDLVNRGPDSAEALSLLEADWAHSVLSNHDAMLMAWCMYRLRGAFKTLDQPEMTAYGQLFEAVGGMDWAPRMLPGDEDKRRMLERLKKLPLVRVIGSASSAGECFMSPQKNRFHVVHAELQVPGDLKNSGFTDADLDVPDSALWDRQQHIDILGERGNWRERVLWSGLLKKALSESMRENEKKKSITIHDNSVARLPKSVENLKKEEKEKIKRSSWKKLLQHYPEPM